MAVPKATVYGLSSKASNAWKSNNPHSGCYEAETTRTLDTRGGDPTCAQGGNIIVQARVFENHGQDTRFRDTGEVCQTVTQKYGTGGGNTPLVVQPAYTIGRDYLTTWEEKAQTLTRSDVPGMVAQPAYGVTSKGNGDCFLTLERHTSLTAGGGQAGQGYPCVAQPYTIGNGQVHDLTLDEKARTINCMHDAQAAIIPQTADEYPYIVRRLMPIECCRLQGYPDWWCDGLQTAEPTEEELDWWIGVFETHRKATKPDTKPRTRNQVRKWLQDPQTDSAEYRMWGNSLAIPNAYQVLAGIAEQIQAEESTQEQSTESEEKQMGEYFTLTARRCKQCGRILVSEESVKRGYGCKCARKARQAELAREPVPGQIGLFDFLKQQTESEE